MVDSLRYFAAMTPTRARPILTKPTAARAVSDADGLIVQGSGGGFQAFWPKTGLWGLPGPSAVAAVLGDASDTYLAELTAAQAGQLLVRLWPAFVATSVGRFLWGGRR